MGVFDFLKVTVFDSKKPTTPTKRKSAGSSIEFDNKSFPLVAINTKGFAASNFDGSLIKGQVARIAVRVDDEFGRFNFATTVGINEATDGKLAGEWNMLPPEVEAVIRKYAQVRKQKTGR